MTSMHCYFCDQSSPEGSLFCKPCGSPFHLAPCPRCAAVNDLKVVSCYKCKAILPIRRAETATSIDGVRKPEAVAEQGAKPTVANVPETAHAAENAASKEPARDAAADAATHAAALVEPTRSPDAPATADAEMRVNQTIDEPRIPPEKVHDESYETTFAPQHDPNYQKTIALQRSTVEAREEPYVKTISLHHPPASLVRVAVPAAAASQSNAGDLPRANAPSPIDLAQKAKWGQRALIASFALLVVVAGAYFSLRAERVERVETPALAITADAMEALPAVAPIKVLEPLSLPPLSLSSSSGASVVGPAQAVGKVPPKVTAPLKSAMPARASPLALPQAQAQTRPPAVNAAAKPVAPNNQQAAKAATNNRVLMMPPDAAKLSAAATAAAIAAALGKTPAQPTPAQPNTPQSSTPQSNPKPDN